MANEKNYKFNKIKLIAGAILIIIFGVFLLILINSCEDNKEDNKAEEIYNSLVDIANEEFKSLKNINKDSNYVESITALTYGDEDNQLKYASKIFLDEEEKYYISLTTILFQNNLDVEKALASLLDDSNRQYSIETEINELYTDYDVSMNSYISSLVNENEYKSYAFRYPNEDIVGISIIMKDDSTISTFIIQYDISKNKSLAINKLIVQSKDENTIVMKLLNQILC